ncbi:MAG: hypothetical protein DHS20C16_08770 [Phycisphaerae bacterium]|nr:MAG: hypothetical protein DHS20C16_08770 [Phycisphaerae bacterium]
MAIQFNCISCLKAIEVADEWANRLVECPYCGDTVTAPGMSQLRPPVATPIESTGAQPIESAGMMASEGAADPRVETQWVPHRHRRPFDVLALAGLLLAILATVLFFWSSITIFAEVSERIGTDFDPEALNEFIEGELKNNSAWLIKFVFGFLGALGSWVIAAVLSVIAVVRNRRTPRGTLAYWALAATGVLPVFLIVGALLG